MNYCAEIHSIKKIFDFVSKFAQTLHKKRSQCNQIRSFLRIPEQDKGNQKSNLVSLKFCNLVGFMDGFS